MKTFETPDCISPETGLSVCKHPELCVCASVNSQKSLYDANKLLEDVMKEDKKYPTLETRLVPIDKAKEDWIIQGVHNDVISTCCLVTSGVNGSWWCGGW